MTYAPHVSHLDAPSDEKAWSPILVLLHDLPDQEIVASASILLHACFDTTSNEKK